MTYFLNTDGGTRGNPGGSACGVFIRTPEYTTEIGEFIENATNNEAEYAGLICALRWLKENKITDDVIINSDSKLIVNQVAGTWQVNVESLIPFWAQAWELYNELKGQCASLILQYVPRAENAEADAICNRVMDEHGVVFQRRERTTQ